MKAMILAAGLGTRLKPWTLKHPKALVPVGGVPMLGRVMENLRKEGYDDIVINIHHFGEQIMEYLEGYGQKVKWQISDERGLLLDTGGGLLAASRILMEKDSEPFLVHNVDILSNASLSDLMRRHKESGADITLLTSMRESSRKLVFGADSRLCGWLNEVSGETRPDTYRHAESDSFEAFSGIYIVGDKGVEALESYSASTGKKSFPVMDFFLSECGRLRIERYCSRELELLDIGKPASLERAQELFL